MFPFSPLSLGLLQVSKASLLKFRPKVQDYGRYPIGILLSLIVLYAALYLANLHRRLPPGPRGYPIIGNILDLRSGQWLKFAEWRKKYGDIIYLHAVGQPIVVLNSHKVAGDLLDRRSMTYSDRPRNIVACDIMTGGHLFALARYDDVCRRMRKAANEGFSKGSVKRFYERQTTEAVLLACDCLGKPAQWDQHFRRAAVSMILSVVYGHAPITSEQDPNVVSINDFSTRVTRAASPGAHLVEFLPWMRYFPSRLAKWKREAEVWYKQDSAMLNGLLHTVEENIVKKGDHESLGATLIREVERNKLSSEERSWVAGTMYMAGAESTSGIMAWWMLAMLAFPETQTRAQAELDAVVGRARLPAFADYPHLPYICAMVKEILRWRTVAPLGLPHRCTEDNWYEGMFIPKGTICIANTWHMNHDPNVYGENAADFDPARHLDASGDIAHGPPNRANIKEEGHVSYGFGRRKCPGLHVADNSLFINIAIMLWATTIERKKVASGQPLALDVDGFVDHGIVIRPVPFECDISPRFPDAPTLLAQERELREL